MWLPCWHVACCRSRVVPFDMRSWSGAGSWDQYREYCKTNVEYDKFSAASTAAATSVATGVHNCDIETLISSQYSVNVATLLELASSPKRPNFVCRHLFKSFQYGEGAYKSPFWTFRIHHIIDVKIEKAYLPPPTYISCHSTKHVKVCPVSGTIFQTILSPSAINLMRPQPTETKLPINFLNCYKQ